MNLPENKDSADVAKQAVTNEKAPKEEKTKQHEPFARAAHEDDDGYDPWSDRTVQEPFWERDPWS